MKRLLACWLLLGSLWVGAALPAQAQRRYYAPRGYYRAPVARPYYGPRYYAPPRYYHSAPYRYYGSRSYYRPRPYYYRRPGPAVIIRP